MNIKAGDKVKCINTEGVENAHPYPLELGKEYLVREVINVSSLNLKTIKHLVVLRDNSMIYNMDRFEVVS